MIVKDGLLLFNCSDCNKNYKKQFNEDLAKRFVNTNKFCDGDVNMFCLMLRKKVYPYEYMLVGRDLMEHHYQIRKNFTVT